MSTRSPVRSKLGLLATIVRDRLQENLRWSLHKIKLESKNIKQPRERRQPGRIKSNHPEQEIDKEIRQLEEYVGHLRMELEH